MSNTNQEIVTIINKLRRFQKIGYMDAFEINEIINDIRHAYNSENQYRLSKMMDNVTDYMVTLSNDYCNFQEYIIGHIDEVALMLNKSSRTIYRKIQNNSFTLIEKQLIIRKLNDADT